MSTSERLANIVKIVPDKLWTLHEIQIKLVEHHSIAITDKTAKNLLAAHPDIKVIKKSVHVGNLPVAKLIGYRAKLLPVRYEPHSFKFWAALTLGPALLAYISGRMAG